MSSQTPSLRDFGSLRYSAGGHPLTRAASQPFGAVLAWLCMRMGLNPNVVTTLALAASLAGSAAYALGGGGASTIAACLVLLQLGYALDCADGQLARATGRTSRFGAWWDVYCDYLAVLALSFAVVARLPRTDASGWSLAIVLFFTFGRIGSLYSSTMARIWRSADQQSTAAAKSPARAAITLLIDTPATLLGICLLRDRPLLLPAFLTLSAALYLLHGTYVGARSALGRSS